MGLHSRGALCCSMQIVLFFALVSHAAAVLISHEQETNTSVTHFGPGACVSAWVGTGSHCVVQTACSEQPAFATYALRLICVDKDDGRVLHSFEAGGFEAQETFDTLIVCDKCEAGDVDEMPQVFLTEKPDEGQRSSLDARAPAPAAAVAAAPGQAAGSAEVYPAEPALGNTEAKINILEEEVRNLTNTAAVISQTISMMREKINSRRKTSRVLRGSSPGPAVSPAPMPAVPGPAPDPAADQAVAESRWAGNLAGALSPIASGLKNLFPGGNDDSDKERENTGRVVESRATSAGSNRAGTAVRKKVETPVPGRLAASEIKENTDGDVEENEDEVVKKSKDGDVTSQAAGKVDETAEAEDNVAAEAERAGREAEAVALAAVQDDISGTKPSSPLAAKTQSTSQSDDISGTQPSSPLAAKTQSTSQSDDISVTEPPSPLAAKTQSTSQSDDISRTEPPSHMAAKAQSTSQSHDISGTEPPSPLAATQSASQSDDMSGTQPSSVLAAKTQSASKSHDSSGTEPSLPLAAKTQSTSQLDDVIRTQPSSPPAAQTQSTSHSVAHMPKATQLRKHSQPGQTVSEKQAAAASRVQLHHRKTSQVRPTAHKDPVAMPGDSKQKHVTQKGETPSKQASFSRQKDTVQVKHFPMWEDSAIMASATMPAKDSKKMRQPATQQAAVQKKSKVPLASDVTQKQAAVQKKSKVPPASDVTQKSGQHASVPKLQAPLALDVTQKSGQHAPVPKLQPKVQSNPNPKSPALAQTKTQAAQAAGTAASETSTSEDLDNVDSDQLADLLVEQMAD